MSDNKISGSELEKLAIYNNLETLHLAANNVKTLKEVEKLKSLEKLVLLDFFNCPVTNEDNYREEVFKMFPNLEVCFYKI